MNRKLASVLAAHLLLPSFCYAHSIGQVDSRGCHEDRRRGNYHCHTGEHAGLTFNSVADLESQIRSGKTVAEMRKEQSKDVNGRSADDQDEGWLSKIPFFGKRSSGERDVESGGLIVPQGIEQRLSALKDLHGKGLVTDDDTACDFPTSPPEFGCAYTNAIYTSGYRYRGRVLGHSMDADGESVGVGALYLDSRAHRWEVLGRNVKINRAGTAPGHSLAECPAKVRDVTLTHERAYSWGNIILLFGYADVDTEGATALEDGLRGFVTWATRFD